MKIVRIVPYLDFGGVEKRLELTAKGFLEHPQHELIILVLSGRGRMAEMVQKMGFKIILLEQNPKIPNFKLMFQIFKVLKEFKPDVVHCSGSEANFHGILAAWLSRVPIRIGEEIGFPDHDWKWGIVFRITYAFSKGVIGISEAVKSRIVALGEVSSQKVEVIYNPVRLGYANQDQESFPTIAKCKRGSENRLRQNECSYIEKIIETEEGKVSLSVKKNGDKKPFVFVTTCRLVAVKNLKILIEVFDKLVKNNPTKEFELWLVGEGPENEKLKTVTNELGIGSIVIFFGFQENVFDFLNQADSFVLPSFSEGFSISLVEAMMVGLPCIATQVGGPSEIIRPNTGFLIDPNNPMDILRKMQKVIGMSEEDRNEMGCLAKEDVLLRFSVEKYVNELLFYYRTFQ